MDARGSSWAGRAILVTGGARRVGRAIALELARAGADLAIGFRRSRAEAEGLARELAGLGVRACALSADLADPARAEALADEAAERLGRLDGLVLNAAVFRRTPLEAVTAADWAEFLAVNAVGPFFLARAAARRMRASPPRAGAAPGEAKGAIVAVADVSAGSPFRGYLPYSVSKAALVAIVKGLAKELAPEVRVNAVAPACVLAPEGAPEDRERFARAARRSFLRRAGSPGDVAAAVRFLLEEPSFVTGTVLAADGGATAAGG